MELRPLDGNKDVNIITSQGENCTSQYTTVGFPTTFILVLPTSDVQVKYIVIIYIVNISAIPLSTFLVVSLITRLQIVTHNVYCKLLYLQVL